MFSVLALTAMIAAFGPSPADSPSASPSPFSTPYTTVTPAPLPGALTAATPLPLPAPTPVPTPVLNVFDNVTLGDTPAAVKKSLGKPFEVDPVNVGEMWRYNADGSNARLSVIFGGSGAMSITLSARSGKKSNFADPFGVVLGMTVDQLTSLRGQPVTVSDNG